MTGARRHQYAALPRLQEVQEEELQRQRELVQQARAQLKEEAAVKAPPPARQQPSMAIRSGGGVIQSVQGCRWGTKSKMGQGPRAVAGHVHQGSALGRLQFTELSTENIYSL